MRNTLWIGFVFFSCTEFRKCLIFSMSVICTYLYFGVRCYNLLNKALSLQSTMPTRLYLELKIT